MQDLDYLHPFEGQSTQCKLATHIQRMGAGSIQYAVERAGVKRNIPYQAVHDPHRGGSRLQCSMLHKSM